MQRAQPAAQQPGEQHGDEHAGQHHRAGDDALLAQEGAAHEHHARQHAGLAQREQLLARALAAAAPVQSRQVVGAEDDHEVEQREALIGLGDEVVQVEAAAQRDRGEVGRARAGDVEHQERQHLEQVAVALEQVGGRVPLLGVVHEARDVRHEAAAEGIPRAGALVHVVHHGAGDVPHLPPARLHAVAPVHVLEVEEEARVHGAHLGHGLPAHHHAGSEHPVHRALGGVVEVEHQVVAQRAASREQLAERRAPQQHGPEGVEAAAGVLQRAVLVEQLRAGDARAGMGVHELHQRVDGAGAHGDVRVQHQHVVAGGGREPQVHRARVAQVHRVLEQRQVRGLGQAGGGVVAAGVVHRDHLERVAAARFPEALHAREDLLAGVVAHVDDGDRLHRDAPCQRPPRSRVKRRRQTIHTASQMIRRFILLTPTRRSVKTMGISLILKPRFQAW